MLLNRRPRVYPSEVLRQASFTFLLLCAGKPRVQEFLAVVQLPGMNLNCQYQHQVHDGDSREAKQEAVGLAMAVELLCRRKHLHAAVNEGSDGEEPHADHGQHQVADVVSREGEKAQERGHNAQQIRVFPLIGHSHLIM